MNKNIKILYIFRIIRSFISGYVTVFLSLFLFNILKLPLLYIGILFSIGALSQALLSFLIGYIGDKYDKIKLLIFISFLYPISLIIFYLFYSNIYLLSLSFILGGFGTVGTLAGGGVGATVTPIINSLIPYYVKEDREKVYSNFIILSGLSGSLGALLLLFNYKFDIIFGIIILTISTLLLFKLEKIENKEEEISEKIVRNEKEISKLIIIAGFLNGAGVGVIYNFIPIIFNHYLGLTKDIISIIYTIIGLLSTLSIYLVEKYIKWSIYDKIIIFRSISMIFLILTLLFVFLSNIILSIISLSGFIIFRVISIPAQQELISENTHKYMTETFGANQSLRIFGSFIFQSIGGYLLSITIFLPFIFSLLFNTLNILIYSKIKKESLNK
ncbi:MAG: MFS transporter [Nanopusillaceae archaeon]